MIKRLLAILLIVSVGLTAPSCGKRKQKYPDGSDKVSEFATINSVKQVFLGMDSTLIRKVAQAANPSSAVANANDLSAAVAWGKLNAAAMAAIQARNGGKLLAAATGFIKTAPKLSLSEEAELFEKSVRELLVNGGWKDLEILMNGFRSTVEVKLLDAGKNDYYTLIGLGEWTEITGLAGSQLSQSCVPGQSVILRQPEAWQNLAGNLALLGKNSGADPAFSEAEAAVRDLLKLLQATPEADLNSPQLAAISAASQKIANLFQPK